MDQLNTGKVKQDNAATSAKLLIANAAYNYVTVEKVGN